MPNRRNNRGRNRRGLQQVQVRADGDVAAMRIDRAISTMRSQESSTVVLCKTLLDLAPVASAQGYSFDFITATTTDDFTSMATQFNTFKIKSMKFEIFPVNSTTRSPIALSTLHGDFTTAPPSSWVTETSVVDAPDAQYLMPGGDKLSFYWNASGARENEFQDVNQFRNFGGLRLNIRGNTVTDVLAVCVMTAQVVFRGRH